MSESIDILLKDLQQNQWIPAVLHDRVDQAYAKAVDDAWLTYLAAVQKNVMVANAPSPVQEHDHWRWEEKVRVTASMLAYPKMAIECNGQVQGMTLLQTDGMFCQLPEQKNRPLVYVYFLATAPWNQGSLVSNPLYSGVGTVFLRAAVEISMDLGFKGRIGLHSLPQAERWYERLGFSYLGPDLQKGSLKYYEFTEQQAAAFLR